MKTLHIKLFIIIFTLVLLTTSNAFAQEYLKVNPVFSKDLSDSCSKLEKKFPGNSYSDS